MQPFLFFVPCGTMFPHVFPFAGDVDVRQASNSIKTAEIAWTRVHAIVNRARALMLVQVAAIGELTERQVASRGAVIVINGHIARS